jgi:hypothetical protein
MTEYIPEILIAAVAAFSLWGIGYLITQDENRKLLFKQQCIESGMQYVRGSCVK